jgi:hypothetical protein
MHRFIVGAVYEDSGDFRIRVVSRTEKTVVFRSNTRRTLRCVVGTENGSESCSYGKCDPPLRVRADRPWKEKI